MSKVRVGEGKVLAEEGEGIQGMGGGKGAGRKWWVGMGKVERRGQGQGLGQGGRRGKGACACLSVPSSLLPPSQSFLPILGQ